MSTSHNRLHTARFIGRGCLSVALLAISVSQATAAQILTYSFNETGTTAPSTGPNTTSVTMRNDAGTAVDLHGGPSSGITGLATDRAFANLGPDTHGSVASASTNGFRADQPDLAAIDSLGSFTLSGWFKTENNVSIIGKTPRLVSNHDEGSGSAGDGFSLQFLSESEDLKLDVDDDSTYANTTGNQFADKQTWVFFAVSYDGTLTTNNVKFYKGYRTDTEALTGTTHVTSAVQLVGTSSLNRGAVDSESAGLVIGNRTSANRPFKGFLDEIRIDGGAGNTGVLSLAQLETIRNVAVSVPEPSSVVLALVGLAGLLVTWRRRR